MGWFSKSNKAKQPTKDSLQAEIEQLKTDITELLGQQAQSQEAVEAACHERDAIRAELEGTLQNERLRHSGAMSDLSQKHQAITIGFAELQQKHQLLDEANVAMAGMVRERDQAIEALQKSIATQQQEHEALVAQRDQRLAEIEAEISSKSAQASVTIAELEEQIALAKESESEISRNFERRLATESEKFSTRIAELERENQSLIEASSRLADLEKRVAADSSTTAVRIAQLEKQVTDSELRSNNRAEQRSALLRNMVEIHRLSSTSSKSEAPSESLKLVNSESTETETGVANPLFGRNASWMESTSDSESA